MELFHHSRLAGGQHLWAHFADLARHVEADSEDGEGDQRCPPAVLHMSGLALSDAMLHGEAAFPPREGHDTSSTARR